MWKGARLTGTEEYDVDADDDGLAGQDEDSLGFDMRAEREGPFFFIFPRLAHPSQEPRGVSPRMVGGSGGG